MEKFFTKRCWIVLVASSLIMLFGLLFEIGAISCDKDKWYFPILTRYIPSLAGLAFAGGIITLITSGKEIIEAYQKELKHLLYADDFLGNRADIEQIWNNVTRSLFKKRFKKINTELLRVIKSKVPHQDISYYENYYVVHQITWDDKRTGMIIVNESTTFDIITDSHEAITLDQFTSVDIGKNNKEGASIELKNISIDGESTDFKQKKRTKEDAIILEFSIKLSGKDRYEIKKEITKKYCIFNDDVIGFKSKYITNKLDAAFELPSDLTIVFLSIGTDKEFSKKRLDHCLLFQNKGLLLPKQGFYAVLKQKNTQQNT